MTPSNLKIEPINNSFKISWVVTESKGLGSQYIYIKPYSSTSWGKPIVVNSTTRSYIFNEVEPNVRYNIRVESFAYSGSVTGTAILESSKPLPSPSTYPYPSIKGTTYYISPNGSDLANGRSPSTAWKTIGHLNNQILQPGDGVLFLANATYSGEIIGMTGNEGSPIIYSVYEGQKATLIDNIWINRHDNIVINGFKVKTIGGRGSNITVQNCEMGGAGTGVNVVVGDRWKLLGNTIKNTGDSGVLTQSGEEKEDKPGKEWLIENCLIENTGTDPSIGYGKHAIYLKCKNSKIINNSFINFSSDGVSQRYGGCIIKGNRIENGEIGIAFFPYERVTDVALNSGWAENTIINTNTGFYAPLENNGNITKENFDITNNVIGPLKSGSKDYINVNTKGIVTKVGNVDQRKRLAPPQSSFVPFDT